MPLVMQRDGPSAVPRLLCDHCCAVIRTAADGNYQWSEAMLEDDTATAMFFTHKECCDAFEAAHGGGHVWSAIGLECLPYFLARNLHVTWQQAQASARLMMRG